MASPSRAAFTATRYSVFGGSLLKRFDNDNEISFMNFFVFGVRPNRTILIDTVIARVKHTFLWVDGRATTSY